MDALPAELLHEIVTHLSPSSRKHARLASRRFNTILAQRPFSILPSFIDPAVALSTLGSTVADLSRRPHSIWSPRCSVPEDLPVPQSFLLAVYVALKGQSWRPLALALAWEPESSSEEESVDGFSSGEEPGRQITVAGLRARLGRKDITEDTLRQAMFRYALYLSYIYDGTGEAPQLWVFHTELWAGKA
ncbi:hypothetical protein TOPH_03598 [Tolypocladium ophioglossoides CBS 100239]|uniref:F-box domain-containing protein n=1 Tax=Tolypocladium ophioglossoides (strain CBS 100239) TaxID=1163406 RepID=A0A0L0NBZ1_TOLOC|nr:hypothetical protein TOPH_03598 [Tolypocladium ophioglossoides CBS 100239]